jgi:RHS repeat-associated protein
LGNITQHVEYIPFGEVFVEERNEKWNTPYLFNGKELDEETGLYYYGARYLDQKLSIWLSVDPLATIIPTLSPYSYVRNNPTNYIDPYGLFETKKEAKEYRKEHGINGKIQRNKDGSFSIDDRKNGVSYTRIRDGEERSNTTGADGVEQSALVVGERDKISNTLKNIAQANDVVDNIGNSLESNAGLTRIGSNSKLYFETSKGGVFKGNQYVKTASLAKYGSKIGRVTGPVGHVVSAAQIVHGVHQDDWQFGYNAQVATAGVVGGMAGAWAGAEAGALVGGKIGAVIGACFGGVGAAPGAVIGGFIGGVAGGIAGGYYGGELGEQMVK